MIKHFKNQNGFSLLELAMVIGITGFAMAVTAQQYQVYMIKQKYETTKENIELSNDVLSEFYAVNGRYPCPANPELPPDDPLFGVEQCRAALSDDCNNTPAGIKCTQVGTRDADSSGESDVVMMGAIPFRTLAEMDDMSTPFYVGAAQDAWNMRFTYAVTELMSDTSKSIVDPASPYYGSIDMIDENSISLLESEQSAHFALISHGDNNLGAFANTGVRNSKCLINAKGEPDAEADPGIVAGIAPEKENCDFNDAIFTKGIRSMAPGTDYYDDFVTFKATGLKQLWTRSLRSSEPRIYNTNIGLVGVGKDPVTNLDIKGDLIVENSVAAQEFCNIAGPDTDLGDGKKDLCLQASLIAGEEEDMKCPVGQVATGIAGGKLTCTPFKLDAAGDPEFWCEGAGNYVRGFSNKANGTAGVYCCNTDNACTFN